MNESKFMLKRFLTLLLILIAFPDIYSQKSAVDSLMVILKNSEGEARINVYSEIAQKLYRTDSNSAIDFSNQALIYAKNTGKNEYIGLAYKNQGLLFYEYLTDDFKAFEAFQNALNYYEKTSDHSEIGNALNYLATIKNYLNDADESVSYSQKAIQIAQQYKDPKIEAGAYYNLGNSFYIQNDFDKALEYHKKSLEIRQKLNDTNSVASSLNRLGNLAYSKQDFKLAEDYYNQVLEIRESQNDKRGSGIALLNSANAKSQLGNMDGAISFYKQAYELFKELGFKQGIASTLNGMGVIYGFWALYPSALKVYMETLEIVESLGDEKEIANTLTNIGIVYNNMTTDTLQKIYGKNFRDSVYLKKMNPNFEYITQAIHYHNLSLEKRRQVNNIRGIGVSLANLGITYSYIGQVSKARKYFEEWLSLADQIQDEDQQTAIYISMGQMDRYEGKYDEAIDFYNKAFATAEKTSMKLYMQTVAEELAQIYELKGDYKLALSYYRKYSETKDSVMTADGQKLIREMQVKYETDAKEKENQLLRKDQVINESKLKQQKIVIFSFIIIILAVIGFVIMLIRQNNQKKKANFELAKKNALITEQKKEITDSIQYASRIQNAVLPPDEFINSLLPENFIIYRPRDIVSGDYYWITEKENKIYIMVADCTGHGVPGAFMSMLGIAFLNEIISKHVEIAANQLLNELRKQVIISLHQTGREGENQDGMDVALYIINKQEMTLEYSGANNSLYIFRDDEVVELKADKMPIGIHRLSNNSFTNYKVDIKKKDMIYAFSDGYTDQFGGPEGKKLMIKNLRKILQTIYNKPVKVQKSVLEKNLDEWMINTHQVDDILVMGVRI